MRRVSRRREQLLSKKRLLPLGLAALAAGLCTAVGLTYATQQNSYLIGCLAAHVAASRGKKNISVVGGVKIPPVDTFLAGYKAGAAKCVKGTTVQIGYSQDFIDQAKCKQVAENQLDAGSQVVFGVAGPCGLGALDAAT